jgi:hypothetical protein
MQSTISDTELGFHAGIDKGDEIALGAFADWLEELDDPRVIGYRFLRDKGVIPIISVEPRSPWSYGRADLRRQMIECLSHKQRIAMKLACVLAAVHEAEVVLPLFEAVYSDNPGPRRAIDTARQWVKAQTDKTVRAPEERTMRLASENASVTTNLALNHANNRRVDAAEQASLASAKAVDTALASDGSACSAVVTATEHAKAALLSVAAVSLTGERVFRVTSDKVIASATSRWRWVECVYKHIALIPDELADKFVCAAPRHATATRREITDAFALAFA